MARLLLAKKTRHTGNNNKDSGTLLSESLGVKVITPKRKNLTDPNCIIINWGLSVLNQSNATVLNKPDCIKIAINKLSTLSLLGEKGVAIPAFTTDKAIAIQTIQDGYKIFCRTLLCSSSGKGIVIATTPEELVDAPLYTVLYKKTGEYRVHVIKRLTGYYFFVQQKKRMTSESLVNNNILNRNKYIRNLANGWVYVECSDEHNSEKLNDLYELALGAITHLDLDFGAVDIMDTENNGLKVLEVNTAPGLKNTKTLEFYKSSFECFK